MLTRRTFIAGAATIAAAGTAATLWLRTRAGPAETRAAARLDEAELRALAALALILFPPTERVTAEVITGTARWWVQGRLARMDDPRPYRDGLTALARAAGDLRPGATFADLPVDEAERLVAGLMEAGPEPFRIVAADLIDGLYTAPPGWRLVGYAAGPGLPAGPLAYTEPPVEI